jgi:hypothetical protein
MTSEHLLQLSDEQATRIVTLKDDIDKFMKADGTPDTERKS